MNDRICLFFLTLLCSYSFAQTWTKIPDIPGPGRDHGCVFVIGDTAYVGTGGTINYMVMNDFYAYCIPTETWITKSDFPGPGRTQGIGFTINGKGYIGLGYGDNGIFSDMWEFDPSTGKWVQMANCPKGVYHPAWEVYDGKLYIFGGGAALGDIKESYCFDPVENIWTKVKNIDGPARHHGSAGTVGDIIYMGMGHSGLYIYKDWYAYDPVADSWTPKADYPIAKGVVAATQTVVDGKVYIICGEHHFNGTEGPAGQADMYDYFFEYDPELDKWNELEKFPAKARWAPMAFSHGSKIFCGFGRDPDSKYPNDMWFYDLGQATAIVNDNKAQLQSKVYPVPTSDILTLENFSQDQIIGLFNSLGQVQNMEFISNNKISLTTVKTGLYNIKLHDGTNIRVLKK